MSWAKLDDGFHSHPKIRRAWREPRAVGLHALALSYVAKYELDGEVPSTFVEDNITDPEARERTINALIEAGLWTRAGEGFVVHDYLDFNPSRAEAESRRKADRERKGIRTESNRNPSGVPPDSSRPRDGSGTGPNRVGKKRQGEGGRVVARVAGKPVSDQERELAGAILAAFNDSVDSAYTLDAHLTPLVMRIRQRPELDAGEHRRVIVANFADPWWDDRPGPNVIYGNDRAFERAIERAKGPAFGQRPASQHPADKRIRERLTSAGVAAA